MSSRLNPGWDRRNFFSIACCSFIGFMGFSLSLRPFVSFVVWTSSESLSPSTSIEWELSPSCISLEPSFMCEENDSQVCFFEGFPKPSIMQTRFFPCASYAHLVPGKPPHALSVRPFLCILLHKRIICLVKIICSLSVHLVSPTPVFPYFMNEPEPHIAHWDGTNEFRRAISLSSPGAICLLS